MEYSADIDGIQNNLSQKVEVQTLYLWHCAATKCIYYLISVNECFTMVKRQNFKGAKNMFYICWRKIGVRDRCYCCCRLFSVQRTFHSFVAHRHRRRHFQHFPCFVIFVDAVIVVSIATAHCCSPTVSCVCKWLLKLKR